MPIQKCSKFNERSFLNNTVFSLIGSYSTFTNKDISSPLVKVYEKAYIWKKKAIIKENIGKSGIYMWTNILTGDVHRTICRFVQKI